MANLRAEGEEILRAGCFPDDKEIRYLCFACSPQCARAIRHMEAIMTTCYGDMGIGITRGISYGTFENHCVANQIHVEFAPYDEEYLLRVMHAELGIETVTHGLSCRPGLSYHVRRDRMDR